MRTWKKFVVSPDMFPPIETEEIKGCDGQLYIWRNETMFTAYKHSCGEFSRFFRGLRDDCRVSGNRCPSCQQIICPPFEQRCPQCNFIEMESVEMSDVGAMVASPVIVFFAPSRFKDQVPFSIGYVFLKDKNGREADAAMLVRARTSQGMIKPGIFTKGTPVKIVFRDERQGEMLDIFVVPQSELNQEQILKNPLMESDILWDKPTEPSFGESTDEKSSDFKRIADMLQALSERIKSSPRAQKDLVGWVRKVKIKTGGGDLRIFINNGRFEIIKYDDLREPDDIVFAVENPAMLLPWLEKGAALTNLVMDGTLWVSKPELETIFRLDRLPRSLRRDNC